MTVDGRAWLTEDQLRRLKNKLRRMNGEESDGQFIQTKSNNAVIVGALYEPDDENNE